MFENIIIININYRDRQQTLGCLRRSNRMTKKGERKGLYRVAGNFVVLDEFIVLIVVMLSEVYSFVKTYQIAK